MEGIFIDLLFTIFCYLVFPVLYRVTEGTVDVKTANKLAIINSIVVCVIFCFFIFKNSLVNHGLLDFPTSRESNTFFSKLQL